MYKINLAATINKQRPDKHGKCAVRIRATVKRKVKYFNTGIMVLPGQFNGGEIIKHPNKNLLNVEIRQQLADIEKKYLEGNISVKIEKTVDFYTYAARRIERHKPSISPGTHRHKLSYYDKLKKFRPTLSFKEITPAFMLEYESYCRDLGNKATTIWSSLKFVRTIVNAAIIDNVINFNPLLGYKQKAYQNPGRNFLSEDEIKAIEKFALGDHSESLINVANWFLFSCYTGLRYEDVRRFDKQKHIVDGRLILRTQKTQSDVSIKLYPKHLDIIERLSERVITNEKMNLYLKAVAEHCKIKKNLTFHVARHTFSVYFMTKGGSMEALQKLLGHSKIQTTAIYGKITNPRIDMEMDKVWGKKKSGK